MNKVPKIFTAFVTLVALGGVLVAGSYLARFEENDASNNAKQPVIVDVSKTTGLLGAVDEKSVLAMQATLQTKTEVTSTSTTYSFELSATNNTQTQIQFSPAIDLFVVDSNGKTQQVFVKEGDPLSSGPFKASESRVGMLYVTLPQGTAPANLIYQPNNASSSIRINF